MEQEAEREVEADAEPGVVQRVEPFEGCWLEDCDEAVDGHRDDDVHGADAAQKVFVRGHWMWACLKELVFRLNVVNVTL